MSDKEKCCVENCNNTYYRKIDGKPYCSKHRTQIMRHGRILEKTIYDPNEIIVKDDYAIIKIINNDNEVFDVLIDLDEVDKVSKFKWHIANGYAATGGSTTERHLLHNLIMGSPHGKDIDHINGNTLDNRKQNLRQITHSGNGANRGHQKNNQLKRKNIHYDKTRDRYVVQIKYGNKRFCRRYKTLDEAIQVRNDIYKEWQIPCERELDSHE